MQAASPSLCSGACALWAAGLTLGPLAVYVWLVFGLRARFLAGAVELDAAILGREHPGRRQLPWIHALLAWPVLFGGFVGGAVLGDLLAPKPAAFGIGATIAVIVFTGFSVCLGRSCAHRQLDIADDRDRQIATDGAGRSVGGGTAPVAPRVSRRRSIAYCGADDRPRATVKPGAAMLSRRKFSP